VAIGNIKTYSGFDGEASEIDVTDLDSTAKEFILGLIDHGSIGIDYFTDFSDAGQDALRVAALSGASVDMILTLTDSPVTTATFTAFVKNAHKLDGGVDAANEGSAALKISGAVVWNN
jgi:hypothetical protein